MLKKAILPSAGLSTRFLPLTKAIPKQVLPLVDEPMIKYPVKEVADADFSQVVFVLSEIRNEILDFFKKNQKLETILKKRGNKKLLQELESFDKNFENLSFSSVIQPQPKGDGDAILRARKQIGKSPFAVLFTDDIFESKIPAIGQMKKIFSTAQKTIIGLKKVPQDKLSSYGVVEAEKIASHLYKIKGFVEKPEQGKAPSDLAVCGRYILLPEIFGYLQKAELNSKGEIILAQAFKDMLADGKTIYGYEINGEWLECGKKSDWIKSNLHLLAKSHEYKDIIKQWIKENK